MRRLGLLLGAAALAGRAAAAVVLASAEAPAVAPIAAAAAPPAALSPLSYVASLTGPAPTLAVAPQFLADRAAQSWLLTNRPEAYPAVVARAFELQDWKATLAAHDDPRTLREAALARADDPIGASPAALLGVVDRDPSLAPRRRLFEIAALEWGAMAEGTRAVLVEQGRDARSWESLTLPERYDAVRAAHETIVARTVTAPPGTPEFAAQYEAAVKRARPVMNDAELAAHAEELARAQSVAEAMTRAERAAGAAGGAAAVLLAEARASGSLDEAAGRVDALLARLGAAPRRVPASRSPSLGLTPRENDAFSAEFARALERELSDTPIGRETLAALRERPARVLVGPTLPDVAARYSTARVEIVVSDRELAALALALGRAPRELLTDPGLRRDAARFFAPFVVHEGAHHRQFTWALADASKAPRVTLYGQHWEHEAYAAQAAFLRQKRAVDPGFAAFVERLRAALPVLAGEHDLPEQLDRDPAGQRRWLERTYRTAPTLARVAAKQIRAGIAAALVDESFAAAARLMARSDAELRRLAQARRVGP
jgi:hypothetical protein